MHFVQIKRVSLAFGDRDILKSVSFTLDSSSRVALAGANGAGKTTLLKLIAGKRPVDDGEVVRSRDCRLGYMAQDDRVDVDLTLLEECEKGFERFFALEREIARLDALSDEKSLYERSELHDILIHGGFYERAGVMDATLRGLGFKAADFNKKLVEFSSGWKMRAALARVLLSQPDILLLDEPSNFLDLETTQWLIDYTRRFEGGILVISHDRHFLNRVTNETLELFNGVVKRYPGSYDDYEKKRDKDLAELIELKRQQDERITQIEAFADRFRYTASKAPLVKSRLKELEKIHRIELPESLKKVSITFPPPPPCGERVLYIEDMSKSYGPGKSVFNKLTLTVTKGDKLAVTGLNGAGKSTLLRIIAGYDKDFTGAMKLGSGVSVGYFSEETHPPFTGSTVLEEVEQNAPLTMQDKLRGLLGAFLFRGDDVYKSVAALSGGERARLLLLSLFLKPFNLLILDEPTNHLDLAAKDALLEALQKYPGTAMFVSHDRYFLDKLAQSVLYMRERPIYYPGDYAYYTSQSSKLAESPREQKIAPPTMEKTDSTPSLSREENKRIQAEKRRNERSEAALLARIEALEEEKRRLEKELCLPENYNSREKAGALATALKEKTAEIERVMMEWEANLL